MSSNIEVKLDVLNQKASPALYAASLADRPAASFTGRLFVDSDSPSTGLYRDTGSSWIQIADSGAGTTGTLQQVTTNGSSTTVGISTSGNGIGIGTTIPATNRLDIHSATGLQATFNGTGTTNSAIQLQLAGVGKWNVTNKYNSAANDFAITDVLNTTDRLTIKNTGQTFIGASTTSSGLLVVNSNVNDNHIVAIGTTAPSIRIRNSGVAASLQCGIGLATTTNNFIQGATGGEFCIYNDSATAQPILLGINNTSVVIEAARISAARNFLINTSTDSGQKLINNGTSYLNGNVGIGVQASTGGLSGYTLLEIANGGASIYSGTNQNLFGANISWSGGTASYKISNFASLYNQQSGKHEFSIAPSGTTGNNITFTTILTIKSSGVINIANVPTSASGLVSGDVYRTANVLNIVP